MKIVHVITRFVRGGADENTLFTCNLQVAAGHSVVLVYGNEVASDMLSRLDNRVVVHQVNSLVREVQFAQDIVALSKLTSMFREIKPDIVHTHTSKAGVLGRLAAKFAGVPVIVHGVHILPFINVKFVERAVYWTIERAIAPFTDAFINVSEGMRAAGIGAGVGKPDRHHVVPSGMEVDDFICAEPIYDGEFVELLPTAVKHWSEAQIVLMAAALERRKRHFEFLDTFRSILDRHPNAVLVFAGTGDQESVLRDRVRSLGLQSNVVFLGFRKDVGRWIKSARVCVLSSEREGLPRVVVQYALCGRPIVATALPGLDDVVKHGRNGFIVDRVGDMLNPVMRLISDDQLNTQCSDFSAKMDLSAWSVDNMSALIEKIYLELLRSRYAR